jgi:hypothetical protein
MACSRQAGRPRESPISSGWKNPTQAQNLPSVCPGVVNLQRLGIAKAHASASLRDASLIGEVSKSPRPFPGTIISAQTPQNPLTPPSPHHRARRLLRILWHHYRRAQTPQNSLTPPSPHHRARRLLRILWHHYRPRVHQGRAHGDLACLPRHRRPAGDGRPPRSHSLARPCLAAAFSGGPVHQTKTGPAMGARRLLRTNDVTAPGW